MSFVYTLKIIQEPDDQAKEKLRSAISELVEPLNVTAEEPQDILFLRTVFLEYEQHHPSYRQTNYKNLSGMFAPIARQYATEVSNSGDAHLKPLLKRAYGSTILVVTSQCMQ